MIAIRCKESELRDILEGVDFDMDIQQNTRSPLCVCDASHVLDTPSNLLSHTHRKLDGLPFSLPLRVGTHLLLRLSSQQGPTQTSRTKYSYFFLSFRVLSYELQPIIYT